MELEGPENMPQERSRSSKDVEELKGHGWDADWEVDVFEKHEGSRDDIACVLEPGTRTNGCSTT